jgi:hypothetical protein
MPRSISLANGPLNYYKQNNKKIQTYKKIQNQIHQLTNKIKRRVDLNKSSSTRKNNQSKLNKLEELKKRINRLSLNYIERNRKEKELQQLQLNEWKRKENQDYLIRIANAKEQQYIKLLTDPKRQHNLITRHAYARRLNLDNINEGNENNYN